MTISSICSGEGYIHPLMVNIQKLAFFTPRLWGPSSLFGFGHVIRTRICQVGRKGISKVFFRHNFFEIGCLFGLSYVQ